MPSSGLKLTRKPVKSPQQQFRIIRAGVARAMEGVVQGDARKRQRVVQEWENEPEFIPQVKVESNKITGFVFIDNPDQFVEGKSHTTASDLWQFWNRGTAPHVIVADEGGVLRFEIDGQTIFARRVNHPGTEAHEDDTRITGETNRIITPKIKQAIKEALKVAARSK